MTDQTERPHLTDEEREDLTVLAAFDGDGILRAPVAHPPLHVGRAMARGHRLSYFTLIDVEPHAVEGHMMRVFRMTDAGLARFTELRKRIEQ